MREILAQLGIQCEIPKLYSLSESRLDRLSEIVRVASGNPRSPFDWRDRDYWPEDKETNETVSQFFTVGNAINFRYWTISDRSDILYCQSSKGGIQCRGAKYMWRSLKVSLDTGDQSFLDSHALASMSMGRIASIFKDDGGHDVVPHLSQRLRNWNDLGQTLSRNWGGSSYDMIKECKGSLIKFVEMSRTIRAFDDPLAKMAMVNAIMHQGRGLVRFSDELFPGIDYQLVKQLLRQGVIVPPENVAKKIMTYTLLTRDEGMYLRRAALCALVELADRASIPGDLLDNLFWQNREICKDREPQCFQCPFASMCAKEVRLLIPLENTRYY